MKLVQLARRSTWPMIRFAFQFRPRSKPKQNSKFPPHHGKSMGKWKKRGKGGGIGRAALPIQDKMHRIPIVSRRRRPRIPRRIRALGIRDSRSQLLRREAYRFPPMELTHRMLKWAYRQFPMSGTLPIFRSRLILLNRRRYRV